MGTTDQWYFRHFGKLVVLPVAIVLYVLTGLTKLPFTYNNFPLTVNTLALILIPIILYLIIQTHYLKRTEMLFIFSLCLIINCFTNFLIGIIALQPGITDEGLSLSWVIVIPATLIFTFLFGLFYDAIRVYELKGIYNTLNS